MADEQNASQREADLTVSEVAAELKLHPQTIRLLLKSGALPYIQCGRVFRIQPRELDAFKKRGGVRPQGRPRKEQQERQNEGEVDL